MENVGDAYTEWLEGMRGLTSSADAATAWRQERWRFAHRLGEALAGPAQSAPAVTGPALYGIWLPWGLLYVGQTLDAARRLRDLPVGESHHLANTFPPEIWDRVVVISWSQIPEATEPVARIGEKAVGLALEHEMQRHASPLVNATKRTTVGGWRLVDPARSKSLGARSASEVSDLVLRVQALWAAGSSSELSTPVMRVVRPVRLLDYPD